MQENQVKKFLDNISEALDKAIICYIDIKWDNPKYNHDSWIVKGTISDEKGNLYKIESFIYDYKGCFQLKDENENLLCKTDWLSYTDNHLEDKFNCFAKVICGNPFEFYELRESVKRTLEKRENFRLQERNFLRDEDDIDSVAVIALNYPTENQKTEFPSTLAAARSFIKEGLTDSNNERSVSENIFSALIGSENRNDRPSDDRYTAYKNDEGFPIKWDFKNYWDLSPYNFEEYCNNKGIFGDLDTPPEIEECKPYLGKANFKVYKKALNDLRRMSGERFSYSHYAVPVFWAEGGQLVVPSDDPMKVLKNKLDTAQSEDTRNKWKVAYNYSVAIKKLKIKQRLPRKFSDKVYQKVDIYK